MKKVLLLLVALCAVSVGGATSVASAEKTATETVSITATGFQPRQVTVHPGDTVTWKNNDKTAHQVVSDTKTVVTDEGTYEYTLHPTIRTDVFATWGNTTSKTQPRIGVRPLVIFRALNRQQNLFYVRVRAAKSYAHKLVRISRRSAHGVWVTT